MRTVKKGDVPLDGSGRATIFRTYEEATAFLKDRLGRYCSYCERTVPASLAVEHKMPKKHYPALERAWSNLLLACSNCNSCKGSSLIREDEFVWPDTDDTYLLIHYARSGAVKARQGLSSSQSARVAATLRLLGLSRRPDESGNTDHRFFDRLEVWEHAEQSRVDLLRNDTSEMRRAIIREAKAKGGFSIWMAVFVGDAPMQADLAAAFPGTRLALVA